MKLKFARGNAKLNKRTAIFSLPAGHTCPGALLCMARANEHTGKITDGVHAEIRCYAASSENLFRNIRVSRWRNFRALLAAKTVSAMADLIHNSLPRKRITLCRVHASGDFFNQSYFDAWLEVARRNPQITFYGYTKALPFWVARLADIPSNLKLVASIGGRFDNLIAKYNFRVSKIVTSEAEAKQLGLKIDHDDTLLWKGNDSFALLLHGTQKAGSLMSKLLYKLRKLGKGGYKADYFAHYAKGAK